MESMLNSPKIAILGANGQVATETAIYLHEKGYPVTCFVRSGFGAFLLRRFTIPVDEIDYGLVSDELKQYDVVLDFTYPSGYSAAQLPAVIKMHVSGIISAMRSGASYVYMSSIMAHGMPDGNRFIKNYTLARSTYSYIKRLVEKFVLKEGKKHRIKAFNFRLGQVHGLLQSVKAEFDRQVHETRISLCGRPDELVNVIFIKCLVFCIEKVCAQDIEPGTYTVVNHPQWTLKELYEHYAARNSIDISIDYDKSIYQVKTKYSLKLFIWSFLRRYRGLLETYLLFRMKGLNTTVKSKFRKVSVKTAVHDRISRSSRYVQGWNLLGRVPTKMIENNDSTHDEVLADSFEMEKKMDDKLGQSKKVPRLEK